MKIKTYGLYMAGMVLLVVGSIFLPQAVFLMQDRYQMESTEVKVRNSLNTSQINISYEEKMYERMKNLTTMNLNSAIVTVVEPDFETDAEMMDLLESILAQEWITMFYAVLLNYGMEVELPFPLEILECKKYMVYNEDYQEGIALMMWYFDLYIPDTDLRIRLLADSETNSIYYIKLEEAPESDYKSDKNMTKEVYDTQAKTVVGFYRAENIKTLYEVAGQFQYFMMYYGSYYEAEMESLEGFEEGELGCAGIKEDDEQYTVFCMFPYGEISMEFRLMILYENGDFPEFSMGIPIIANLIPEMIQD